MRLVTICLVSLAGCQSPTGLSVQPLASNVEQSDNCTDEVQRAAPITSQPDLSSAPSCADIQSGISSWLAAHESCVADADCRLIWVAQSSCFNGCQVAVNDEGDATLASLTAAYQGQHCGTVGCACTMPVQPTCSSGSCK
jgi:hypothetical protein